MSIIRRAGPLLDVSFLMCFSPILTLVTTLLCKYDDFFGHCALALQEMQGAKITQIVKLCNLNDYDL